MPTIRVNKGDLTEKEYWEKGYRDNYGYFLKWGGIHSWWTAITYFFGGSHVLFFTYTAYLKMDDIERLTEALHFAFFIMVVGPNTVVGIIHRKNFDKLYTAIGKGFYDYEGTLTQNCLSKKSLITSGARKRKHFLSKSYITLVMIACIALCLARPVANFIMDSYENKEPFDGILTHSIAVICWYPLDTRDPINFYIAATIQYVTILITPGVVFQMAISFLCFSEEICAQLDIVCLSLKNCQERAIMTMETKNLKYEQSIRICLNHSIKHHLQMINLFNDFQLIYSYVLFILMIGSTFLLCLCGVNFMAPTVSINSKAYFCLFIISETANIFIYCYYGELIKQKASSTSFSLYDCNSWIDDPIIFKCYLLLVQARCESPLLLSACGYMDASLSTFSNVLSSSYSYFNLLNLLNSK